MDSGQLPDYRELFDRAPDAMIVLRDGVVAECNPKASALLGLPREEIIGRKPWEFHARPDGVRVDDSRALVESRLKRVLDGEQLRFEQVYSRPDGTSFTAELSMTRLGDNENASVLAIVRDVSGRDRAEALLRESETRFRNLTDNLPGVVYACANDERWTVSYINDSVEALTGYAARAFLNDEISFKDLIHTDDKAMVRSDVESALEKRDKFELTYRIRTKDGQLRWIHGMGVGVFDGDRLLHIQGFAHDVTEQQITEARLVESEAFHRAIVEDQTEFIVRWLPDGTRTFVNDAYCRYYGLKREDAIGTSFFPLIAEKDRQTVADRIDSLTPENPESTAEHEVVRPDGTPAWQRWTDRAIFDADGNVVGYQSTGREITEIRLAQQEALRAAELFRAAIEHSPAGILVADAPDVNIRHVNQAATEIRGETTARLDGIALDEHVDSWRVLRPDRTPYDAADLPLSRAVLNGETTKGREMIIRRDNGEERWVDAEAAPIRNSDGEIIAGIGVFLDVTDKKRAEEMARQSRFSLDHSPEGVFWADEEATFTYVNDAACKSLGYTRDELVGMKVFDITPNRSAESWPKLWRRLRRDGSVSFQTSHRRKDGSLFPVELTIAYGIFEGKEYAFGLARDISELIASREQLRALAMKLSAVEERERRTIATYLHDQIGQSLAVLRMRVGALSEVSESETFIRAVHDIRELLDQAIDDTRTLTFDLSPPILYELGLGAAIEWVAEKICNEHGLALDFREDGSAQLDADRAAQLFRGARELLMNTVKHARASKVTISVESSGDGVRVVVEDNGTGFDVGDLMNRSIDSGFGILSIRERMRFIGGHLEIDSEIGRGTRSSLVVPSRQQVVSP